MGCQNCKSDQVYLVNTEFQTQLPLQSYSTLLCKIPARIRNKEPMDLALFLLEYGGKQFNDIAIEKEYQLSARERTITIQELDYLFRDCQHQKAIKLCDGSIYQGQWAYGIRNGYGVCTYTNGNYYEGYWLNDLRHGYGILDQGDHIYEGKWFGDQQFDEGKVYSKQDEQNVITLKMNLEKRGEELVKTSSPMSVDNNFYFGEVQNGMMEGFGVMRFEDGNEYIGHFQRDQIHGLGIMKQKNGKVYTGFFDQGQMSGIGELDEADGKYYGKEDKWSYLEDQKWGFGIYMWNKKKVIYKGYFREGKQNGKGKLITEKDQQGEYIFQNGQRKEDKFGRQYTKKIQKSQD